MVDDLTVLLVGDGEPNEKLFEQLEKKDLSVEISALEEFPSLLALVEPHLVIQVGTKGAEDTVRILKESEEVRRVRLVIVAPRDDLNDLRKLDRTVVISLLADDIAPSVVAARVTMLAKKGPEKSEGIPSRAPRPPESPKATAPQPTAAKLAAPKPAAPKPAVPKLAAPQPAAPKAVVPSPANPEAAPSKKPVIPRATSLKPTPAPEPPAQHAAAPRQDAPAPVDAPEPEFGFDAESAEELTVAFDAPLPSMALKPAGAPPRVLVADTDVTRADYIACALRERGIIARIVPLDVAATHWALVRDFAPTVLLGDATSLNGTGQVWLQLLQADQALKRAKLVSIPFERVFSLDTAEVNLRTLIPHIPQLSADIKNEAKPTRGPTPPPQPKEAEAKDKREESSPEAPPPIEDDDDQFERMTVTHPVDVPEEARSSLPPSLPGAGILEDRGRQASIADIDELDVLDSVAPSHPSAHDAAAIPDSVPHHHTSRSAPTLLEGNKRLSERPRVTSRPPPAKSSGVFKVVLFLLVLGLGGVGTWLALGNEILGFSFPSMKGTKTQGTPKGAPGPVTPPAPSPADAERDVPPIEEEPADPLWVIPPKEPAKTCEELVTNLDVLKVGGIQQATLSWNQARQKMVLGDLDRAQVLMCEAVLLHEESLALEGLVSLYVTNRQPEQAARWIELALKVRGDRIKTLEVLGDVHSIRGKVDEAKKAFADALKVETSDQKVLDAVAEKTANEAESHLRAGAIAQAELLFRRAATLSPTNAKAAAGMAASHAAAGRTEGAQLWAEKTLNLDPENPVALVVQAGLVTEGGDSDRAIELCRRALKVDPTYPPAHALLRQLEGE